MLRVRKGNGSLTFALGEIAVGGWPERGGECKKGGGSQNGEVQGDGGTKVWCHDPDAALSLIKRVDSSRSSDSSDSTGAREIYSSENVSTSMIEVMSSTIWQEDVTAEW